VVPVLAFFLVQPSPWWARFTLPLAAVGAVAVVAVAELLRPVVARRALRVGVLGLALLGVLLVVGKVNPASGAAPLPAWRVVALVGAPSAERSVGRLFFPEYRFLEEVPASATVVADLGAPDLRFVYLLFGPGLTRRVVPAGSGPVPDSAWVVTSAGRPLDDQLVQSRPGPVSDLNGVRAWAPVG